MKGDRLSGKVVYVVVDEKGKLVVEAGIAKTKAGAELRLVEDDGETTRRAIVIEA